MHRTLPKSVANLNRSDKGAYILEFRLVESTNCIVGKLGSFRLKPGCYYYIGSARNGLRGRLKRHILGIGKLHWHIDYLTRLVKPDRIWYVLSESKLETSIADIVASRTRPAIKRFGCGDSPGSTTHLFYSKSRRNFLKDLREFGPAGQVEIK